MHQLDAGIVLYLARRYDEAIAQFRRLIGDETGPCVCTFPARAFVCSEPAVREALDALDRAGSGGRLQVQQHTLRGYIHARTGRHNLAAQELERLERDAANWRPWRGR